ncbi:MAG: SCO family protein, partial [Chromatiales bacterium]
LLAPMNLFAEQAGHSSHQPVAIDSGKVDPHAHHRAMLKQANEAAKPADIELKDLPLIDQDGHEVKFVSDVIGDRIVVMDFVYTSCTTVCPVLSALFGQLQERLGAQLGAEVALVSVSVDPTRDTPQRLKAYATRHQARPGWVWLTGPKRRMDEVLDGLGAYSPNFADHPSMVLVGDGRTGAWSRLFGFPSPDRLMEQVNALQVARRHAVEG